MTHPTSDDSPLVGHGFILSRRAIRHAGAEHIELWVATKWGPRCLHSPPQSNICFISQHQHPTLATLAREHNLDVEHVSTHLKTLSQQPLHLCRCSNNAVFRQLCQLAATHNIVLYEADIKSVDRFLMERFAYGSIAFKSASQSNEGVLEHTDVRGADYKPELTSLTIDIECDEHETLYSIAIASTNHHRVFLHYPGDAVAKKSAQFTLIQLESEKAVLQAFCQEIEQIDPDVILGWNVKQFDFAVLSRIAERLKIALPLGRMKTPLKVTQWSNGQTWVDVPGRCVIDGIEALKTMTYQFPSFSLEHVAQSLLAKGKLINDGKDKLAEIKALYQHAPEQLAAYNHQDCVLVNDIAAKTRLIDFLVLRSKLTGLDMSRPGGSVAAFINVYLPKLHRAGYVSGIRPKNGGLASPGGYVMSSRPGLYNNVLVLDFKSLYPSIIRTFLIDPLGLAEGLRDPDTAIPGFRGAVFSREKHFLPAIIENLWKQRDEAKKQADAPRSQAIKILMNSFYGVLGSGGCPFYDPRLASSITLRGHEIMQTTAAWIEEMGYDVIYGDTDSTFIHIRENVDDTGAHAIGKQMETEINKRWQTQLRNRYQLACHLEIEFETHYRRFFMPTIRGSDEGSKKRYAGLTQQNGSAKLIFKGLENVRSDWTALARRFQEALYLRIFHEEPVEEYIRQLVNEIRSGRWDNQLVYAKRLRKPLSDYTRSQPPHVKAARIADDENRKRGRKEQYQQRGTIHYVITIHGPRVAESNTLPLDYDHYIDKQIKPIADGILPAIGLAFDTIGHQQIGLFS